MNKKTEKRAVHADISESEEDSIYNGAIEFWNRLLEARDVQAPDDEKHFEVIFIAMANAYKEVAVNYRLRSPGLDVSNKINDAANFDEEIEDGQAAECVANFVGILNTPLGRQKYKDDKWLMSALDFALERGFK